MTALSAQDVVAALEAIASPAAVPQVARFFRPDPNGHSEDNEILGVGIGSVFPVAKRFTTLPLDEVEQLLEDRHYEVRMAAVSIMDFQARAKRLTEQQSQALYDLYLRRHDRINNWDLVDRSAGWVVGRHLEDKSRQPLYDLALSPNPWERRTSIVATTYYLRSGQIDDTFAIAEILAADPHDLVQKAVGSWIRTAGTSDEARLLAFLDRYQATMSREAVRYAVEKLSPDRRARYVKSRPTST